MRMQGVRRFQTGGLQPAAVAAPGALAGVPAPTAPFATPLAGAALQGMSPAGIQAALAANQARSAGAAPPVGGVNPILPAGGPGGAAFGPLAAGAPGTGAAAAGLNPVAIQQAALARRGMMPGTLGTLPATASTTPGIMGTPGAMARGGRVREASGRISGGGGRGHQPDVQFGLSGPRPRREPKPQARREEAKGREHRMEGMARGGRALAANERGRVHRAAAECKAEGGRVLVPPSRAAQRARHAEERRAEGGRVLVPPSRAAQRARRAEERKAEGGRIRKPSGQVTGGATAGPGPDTQFGLSGTAAPPPKKLPARQWGDSAGLARGGRVRVASGRVMGGGGLGHQGDAQFGVSGPRPPSPKQAASRSFGSATRSAEDVPFVQARAARTPVVRRPTVAPLNEPIPTPSPVDQTDDTATGMARGGKWIAGAIKRPGALRRALGVKSGETIPAGKLAKAAKVPGRLGKQARLAKTLRSFHKAKGGKCPEKMAAGGAAKQRRGFPKTIPPPSPAPRRRFAEGGRVRGCGIAERGCRFTGVF